MKRAFSIPFAAICLLVFAGIVAGCGDPDNRVPTKAEGQAANVKRLSYIDSLPNIPPDQKARMKAQMGGPPVSSPADTARAKAGQDGKTGPTGR